MATVNLVAGSRGEYRGLLHWMERVLKELEKVREAPEAEAVHDLRVAIRRCRSVAAVMQEVDPDAAWPEMKKLGRKLFRKLGILRDKQVLTEWVKSISEEEDGLRQVVLAEFEKGEAQLREDALRATARFDEKAWRKYARMLQRRARLVPLNGRAAECLALERLETAKELHAKALRTEKPEAWHALRVGVKRFRYAVESLLPERCEVWEAELKRVQDLLGDVHDLDVLRATVAQHATEEWKAARSVWEERIKQERELRLEKYRELTQGKTSLWHIWREGLPFGKRLEAAGLARLRATARAMEGNAPRNAQVARLATRLYEALAKAKVSAVFEDLELRKIMRAAARLHGIGATLEGKPAQKAASDFLREMARPAGWDEAEWELLAQVVRYHRGTEPKEKHKAFARLTGESRRAISLLAGILRLARVMRKCGVESAAGLTAEKSVEALIVRAVGLLDSEETAARLARGKHLLESSLEMPVILRAAAPEQEKVVELPRVAEFSGAAD